MTEPRTLHVEILPHGVSEQGKGEASKDGALLAGARRTLPLTALERLSRLLSKRNIELLQLIKSAEPQSLTELALLSCRPKASLTVTLRRLRSFGIIGYRQTDGRRKIPIVACDRLRLDVSLGGSQRN